MVKKELKLAFIIVGSLLLLAYLITSWQNKTVPVSYLSKIPLSSPPRAEKVDELRNAILKDQIKKQKLDGRDIYVSQLTFNLLNLPDSAITTESLSATVLKNLPAKAQLVDPQNAKIPRTAVKAIFSSFLQVDSYFLLAAEINGKYALYQIKPAGLNNYQPVEIKAPKNKEAKAYGVTANESKIMAAALSTTLSGQRFPLVYILNKTSETINTTIFPARMLPSNFVSFLRGIPAARLINSIESVMPNWQEGPRGGGIIVFISNIHRINDKMYINLDLIGGQNKSSFVTYQIWLKGKTVILKNVRTGITLTFNVN